MRTFLFLFIFAAVLICFYLFTTYGRRFQWEPKAVFSLDGFSQF